MAKPTTTTPAVYFQSLTVANVKCFHEEQTIDLSDGGDGFARWTVILGENNTGKTTLLNALFELEPSKTAPGNSDSSTIELTGYLQKFVDRNFFARKIFTGTKEKFEYSSTVVLYENNNIERHKTEIAFNNENELNVKIVFNNNNFKNSFLNYYDVGRSNYSNLILDFKNNNENIENWVTQLELLSYSNKKAKENYNKLIKILTSGILPEVEKIEVQSEQQTATKFYRYLSCLTPYGWAPVRELGYGYQSMMVWILDLVRRMMDRYPESENPLAEPVIVLVDEIDLHLHPEWQRKIISHLTKHFPNAQFIVTAHSPSIIQSAESINVILLRREGDHTRIEQPKLRDYRGWSVEEILDDLMGLEDRVRSDRYLDLVHAFNTAIQDDSYASAIEAYEELMKILPEGSHLRQLFKIQLSDVNPV